MVRFGADNSVMTNSNAIYGNTGGQCASIDDRPAGSMEGLGDFPGP